MKKTTKTKKTSKTAAKSVTGLISSRQWLIIALLVMILFAFACLVYGADLIWNARSSS